MQPPDCPEWEYENHPHHEDVLIRQVSEILAALRQGTLNTLQTAIDTRPVHQHLFRNLVPPGYEYFAGHYRGEAFRCLEHYEVAVRGDPRVGCPAEFVLGYMRELSRIIHDTTASLDAGHVQPHAQFSATDKLLYLVAATCRIFEFFLRIHPYANGNGHTARFCIWALLGRYGYWLSGWPIEPRPPDPPYTDLISAYRNGHPEALEKYILSCCRAARP